MSYFFKYLLILFIFLSSVNLRLVDVFAYSVQELELRYGNGEYEQVIDEALDNIRFDPHDKISLEFLQNAKKAVDDLKRAQRYLDDEDYRSALIIFMKLKAKSQQSVSLSKSINEIQKKLQEQELTQLKIDFNIYVDKIENQIETGDFESAETMLIKLNKLLADFKYQDRIEQFVREFNSLERELEKKKSVKIDKMFNIELDSCHSYLESNNVDAADDCLQNVSSGYAQERFKVRLAKLASQIEVERDKIRLKKMSASLMRRIERARNYYANGDYERAQRTLAGIYIRDYDAKSLASLNREIKNLNQDIATALGKKKEKEEEQLKQKRINSINNIKSAIANDNFQQANAALDEFSQNYPNDPMFAVLSSKLELERANHTLMIAKKKEEETAAEKIKDIRQYGEELLLKNDFDKLLARINESGNTDNVTLNKYLSVYKAEVIKTKNEYELAQKQKYCDELIHKLETALTEKKVSDADKILSELIKENPSDVRVIKFKNKLDKIKIEIKERLRKRAKAKALEMKREKERAAKKQARAERLEQQRLQKEKLLKQEEELREEKMRAKELLTKRKQEQRQELLRLKQEDAKRKEELRLERIRKKEEELKRKEELVAQRKQEREAQYHAEKEAKEKAIRKRELKKRIEKQRKERLQREAAEAKKRELELAQQAKEESARRKVELNELLWQVESFETAKDYVKAIELISKIKENSDSDKRIYDIEKRILKKQKNALQAKRDDRKRLSKEREEKAQKELELAAKKEQTAKEKLFGALQTSFDVALKNDDVKGAQEILLKMKDTFTDELSQALLMANNSIIHSRQTDKKIEKEKSLIALDDVKFDAACDDIRRSINENEFMIAKARIVVLKKQNSEDAKKLEVISQLEESLHKERILFENEQKRKDQQAKLRKIEILISEDKYDQASLIAKQMLADYPDNKKFIGVSKLIERQRQRLKDLCGDRCAQVFAKEKQKSSIVVEKPIVIEKTVVEEVEEPNIKVIEEIKRTDYKDYINNLERKVQTSIEKDRKTVKTVFAEPAKSVDSSKLINDDDLKQTLRDINRMINRKEFVKAFDTSTILKQQYPNNDKVELINQLSRTHMRHLRLQEAKEREEKEKQEQYRQKIYDAQLLVDAEDYSQAISSLEVIKKEYPGDKQVFKLLRSATIKQKQQKKAKRRELKEKIAKRKEERLKARSIEKAISKTKIEGTEKPDPDTKYFDQQIRKTQSLIKRQNIDTQVFENEIRKLRSQILQRDLSIADRSISKIRTVYNAVKGIDKQLAELEKRIDDIAKKKSISVKVSETRAQRIDRARKLRNDRTQRLDNEINNYERTIRALIDGEEFDAAITKIEELRADSRFGEKAQAVAAEMASLLKKTKSKYDMHKRQEKLQQLLAQVKTLKASGRLQTAKKQLDDSKDEFYEEPEFLKLYERLENEILIRHQKAKAKREKRLKKLRRARAIKASKDLKKEKLKRETEEKLKKEASKQANRQPSKQDSAELDHKLKKEEYRKQLTTLKKYVRSGQHEVAVDLIKLIESQYAVEKTFKMLKERNEIKLEELRRQKETLRAQRLALKRKKDADKKLIDSSRTAITKMLSEKRFNNAYSLLDTTRLQLQLDESKIELIELETFVNESYKTDLRAKQEIDDKLWNESVADFNRQLDDENFVLAREKLWAIKQELSSKVRFGQKIEELEAKFNSAYQTNLAKSKLFDLNADVDKFRLYLKKTKFAKAQKLLLDMRRKYGKQDILDDLDKQYKKDYSKYQEQKERLRQQRFELLVKETKVAIAKLDFEIAQERIKVLKTLYIQRKDQLRLIARLDKDIATMKLRLERQQQTEEYNNALAKVEQLMQDRSYSAAIDEISQMLTAFPKKRRALKTVQKDVQQKQKLLQEEELSSIEREYTRKLDKAVEQLDALMLARDWNAMAESLAVFQEQFPLEEAFVEYSAKMEKAKLEDQHKIKIRLRSRIDKRTEESNAKLLEHHEQDCRIFEAKLLEFENELKSLSDNKAILKAYGRLDELYKSSPDVIYAEQLHKINKRLDVMQEDIDNELKESEEQRFTSQYSIVKQLLKQNNYYQAQHRFNSMQAEFGKISQYIIKINELEKELLRIKSLI